MAAKKRRRKPGRPKGSKNKKRTAKKKGTRKKSRKKAKKARRSGKVPSAVIVMRAKSLKKNKRAAAIYRDVLGC
jgi:hypothetical protein